METGDLSQNLILQVRKEFSNRLGFLCRVKLVFSIGLWSCDFSCPSSSNSQICFFSSRFPLQLRKTYLFKIAGYLSFQSSIYYFLAQFSSDDEFEPVSNFTSSIRNLQFFAMKHTSYWRSIIGHLPYLIIYLFKFALLNYKLYNQKLSILSSNSSLVIFIINLRKIISKD